MVTARKLLILGGIALALLGMGYGMWYAIFLEHQELGSIGGNLAAGFSAAAERNPAAADAALKQYRELKYAYDRHVDVHGHWNTGQIGETLGGAISDGQVQDGAICVKHDSGADNIAGAGAIGDCGHLVAGAQTHSDVGAGG